MLSTLSFESYSSATVARVSRSCSGKVAIVLKHMRLPEYHIPVEALAFCEEGCVFVLVDKDQARTTRLPLSPSRKSQGVIVLFESGRELGSRAYRECPGYSFLLRVYSSAPCVDDWTAFFSC